MLFSEEEVEEGSSGLPMELLRDYCQRGSWV